MAVYDKRYQLIDAPTPRNDGSGCVDHDIQAMYTLTGEDEWSPVPGRHKTISVPEDELQAALAAGGASAIATAYKEAIAANLNTIPEPIRGWSSAQLEELLLANAAAADAAEKSVNFITVSLGLDFPVNFTI